MQLGMIGLGRMGANMVRRLMKEGHEAIVYPITTWGEMAAGVAAKVANGELDQGIVCCWTSAATPSSGSSSRSRG